jgi:hypothetical protein
MMLFISFLIPLFLSLPTEKSVVETTAVHASFSAVTASTANLTIIPAGLKMPFRFSNKLGRVAGGGKAGKADTSIQATTQAGSLLASVAIGN